MHFNPEEIAALQNTLTARWHVEVPRATGENFLRLVEENHLRNFQLWHEEDIARRDDLGSERIHQAKRAIDRFNQQRNNFIEEIDQALVVALEPAAVGCPKNSETPGMIIDRLSIMSLKQFHMREEAERAEASVAHRTTCSEKLVRLVLQRGDLVQCLSQLLGEVANKTRSFAVYYQFKMYNDPALNPQLYRATPASGNSLS